MDYWGNVAYSTLQQSANAPDMRRKHLGGGETGINVRKSTLQDLPRIMEIYARARIFMAEHGNPDQWGPTCWPPEALIRKDIADGSSYVCVNETGRILGTFFFIHGADVEPTYREITDGAWLDGSPYGVVHRIASDGSEKGVGGFCLDWAYEQCGHLRIDTHGDNTVMQNLLRKLGFIHCGTIYVEEDDAPRLAFEKSEAAVRQRGSGETRYEADRTITVNGVTLHYAAAGEGAPVVLIHGNSEDHSIFDHEIRQLTAAGYRVFAPDSRGHGANDPLPEYHYADMAEDVYEFITALGLHRPALYGFSDGGIIGLLLSLRHPGALSVLAISGANLSPSGLVPSFLVEYTALSETQPDPLLTLMLTEPRIDPEELKAIRIPVLVTAGEHDLILRSETERIASSLPDAEMLILEGEDHGSYIVDSDIMGNLLLRFLESRGYLPR